MSCFEKHPMFSIHQLLFQCQIGTGSMRIKQIPIRFIYLTNSLTDLIIRISSTRYQCTYLIDIAIKQSLDSCKIAGCSYVHGIGNSGNGRSRMVSTCLQILIEDIIAIVRGNEPANRKSHLPSHQTCSQIAKVSTGYTYHQLVGHPLHLCISIEIIKRLRYQSTQID